MLIKVIILSCWVIKFFVLKASYLQVNQINMIIKVTVFNYRKIT